MDAPNMRTLNCLLWARARSGWCAVVSRLKVATLIALQLALMPSIGCVDSAIGVHRCPIDMKRPEAAYPIWKLDQSFSCCVLQVRRGCRFARRHGPEAWLCSK